MPIKKIPCGIKQLSLAKPYSNDLFFRKSIFAFIWQVLLGIAF
ncbi:hypothetical protein EV11_1185 [Prochlorococcus sp. SS52]|nr:hypothetical protein EV04_0542 [Prochlorococcus marinus str. LG]KGG19190.1 hypothetical protein EV08_1677 [Prochlorococcus marinus str. SS2]KGG25175.1 hypothetical protein EV09_0069 [Prochlorococcus marinus str. SS35]KGG32495.1 hypothetical protein EV10_1610 [Prochlorococcus marinus str. SS51]KGG35621.1 hypothetical protein EV11_1185 [Prochlorococcus sp. SS52]